MKSILSALIGFAWGVFACSAPAFAGADKGFDPFVKDDLSPPGSAKTIADPTGSAPTKKVQSFSLPAGYCNPKPYDKGSKDSDCTYNSSRSQFRENVFATKRNKNGQPPEAWYGWSVYFPQDFPYGYSQTRGHYEFVYWHNHKCPHLSFAGFPGSDNGLYLQTNKAVGGFDCAPLQKLRVADFKELVGKWTRFEVQVKWANDDSGRATVFMNGMHVLDYKGATLTEGLGSINYFKYGIYICCTSDVKKIKQATVLYSGIKRAATREELITK
jgi:hypothetical protein